MTTTSTSTKPTNDATYHVWRRTNEGKVFLGLADGELSPELVVKAWGADSVAHQCLVGSLDTKKAERLRGLRMQIITLRQKLTELRQAYLQVQAVDKKRKLCVAWGKDAEGRRTQLLAIVKQPCTAELIEAAFGPNIEVEEHQPWLISSEEADKMEQARLAIAEVEQKEAELKAEFEKIFTEDGSLDMLD